MPRSPTRRDWLIDLAVSAGNSGGIPDGEREPNEDLEAPLDMVAAAAATITNDDLDWETWNKAGMAIFAASGGSRDGFPIFDHFSKKAAKYNAHTTMERWQSYHRSPPTRIGFGSLHHWACQADPNWFPDFEAQVAADLHAAAMDPEFHGLGGDDAKEATADLGGARAEQANGHYRSGNGFDAKAETKDEQRHDNAPVSGAIPVSAWLMRELPKPDFILGKWLTTTSRTMLYASTGIGKTMFSIAMAMAMASGRPFLHWQVARPSRVLLIDGEMARRVMKDRIAAEANRLGVVPDTMYVLSHEDVMKFKPLNVKEGRMFINDEIKRIGGVDFIIFDNIMSLISGDMKEEDSWRKTLPWIRWLTRKSIGQMWLHHTGHDASHSYGTKTREWQLDNLIRLETVDKPGIDVSFKLSFEKAREREPSNRRDFEDVTVTLDNDAWTFSRAGGAGQKPMSPMGEQFYRALCHACDRLIEWLRRDDHRGWREACFGCGLLDRTRRAASNRALFSKYRTGADPAKLDRLQRNSGLADRAELGPWTCQCRTSACRWSSRWMKKP